MGNTTDWKYVYYIKNNIKEYQQIGMQLNQINNHITVARKT